MKVQDIMQRLAAKHPGEAEYLQAVQEVLESIEEVYNQHPEFELSLPSADTMFLLSLPANTICTTSIVAPSVMRRPLWN